MKKFACFLVISTLLFITVSYADAELHDRGNGLIYDNTLDITWLQYANYSGETLSWTEATNWVDALIYQGYDDWRLPESDASCSGYTCTDSEMGHLFYMDGVSSDSPGFFLDLRPYMYWSSTEYDPDSSRAVRFHFSTGYQGTSSKTTNRYAWAVRDGDSVSSVAPEPVSSTLFIIGGAALGLRRLGRRRGTS